MATLETIEGLLSGMTPEERSALIETLAKRYQSERETIGMHEAYADDELSDTPAPDMIDAGRYKVAASPMSFIGTALRRGLGDIEHYRNRDALRGLDRQAQAGTSQIMSRLASGGRAPGAASEAARFAEVLRRRSNRY